MSKKSKKQEIQQDSSEEDASHKILLRQMREEARREKIQTLFAKYKKQITYLVSIVLIIIIATSVYSVNQQFNNEKYSKLIHQFVVYESSNQNEKGEKILDEIKNSKSAPVHIQSISLLRYGSNLVAQNKVKEAVELYLKVYELKSADPYIRELSALLAIKSMIDSNNEEFNEKISSLLPKLEKNSSILRPLILEQKAIFEWYLGNLEKAQEIFENLSLDLEAPQYLKNRTKEFSNIIINKI